jgi:hypothetical protein
MIYIAPGDIVEGIPVSDIPVPEAVSPTVTAALEAGGQFNPQRWLYPPLPLPDPQHGDAHHHHHHVSGGGMPTASGAVMGMPHQQGGAGALANQYMQHQHQQEHQPYQHFNYHQHQHSNLGDLAAAAVGEPIGHDPAPAVWTDNGEGWAEGWPMHQEEEEEDDDDERLMNDGGDEKKINKNHGGGGGGGGGGSGNNNIVVDDDDDDDPPLIPAVASAGELHHMV